MAGDPYFDKVSLLLPMDSSFADLSFMQKSVTAVGNASINTTQSKFGGASGYFDGSGDYLSIPLNADFGFGSGDFTLEAWVYPVVLTGSDRGITDLRHYSDASDPNPVGATMFLDSANGFKLALWDNSVKYGSAGTAPALNTWSHVAITRSGTTLRGFIGGVQQFSVSHSKDLGSSSICGIGGYAGIYGAAIGSSPFNGYIDDIRITKGVARYTSNFTPPVTPNQNWFSQILGALSESLAATTFVAETHNLSDGVLSGRTVFSGSNFTVNINTAEKLHTLTVKPDIGTNWKANSYYAVGAKVLPNDPVTTPYYYNRLVAGTSGSTEPTWPTTPGGQCNDGGQANAWELVERLVQPITHGPLIAS